MGRPYPCRRLGPASDDVDRAQWKSMTDDALHIAAELVREIGMDNGFERDGARA